MTPDSDPGPDPRLSEAFTKFDAANAEDSRLDNGRPYALVYGERMSTWIDKYEPDASEALKLAARSQHIRRWEIPRDSYPKDRDGYKAWRSALAKFHSKTAAALLREVGYDDQLVDRVSDLLQKKKLKIDPETQVLEDVACLVFLEYYFGGFSEEHDEPKLIRIVQRTWLKMSDRGHDEALKLDFSPANLALIQKALAP